MNSRYTMHKVMICQDLVRHYGKAQTSPGCMLRLDMRKAYDTIDWRFLKDILEKLGFLGRFIGDIITCVTTAKFSMKFNGVMHGYFPS